MATLRTLDNFSYGSHLGIPDYPEVSLIDTAGNLFGTTFMGGINGEGSVFEIANTGGTYASTLTTLVSFNGTDGGGLDTSLIADAAGDLFGTTFAGGDANGNGTVFEIIKTNGSYASTPATLVSFNGTNGAGPEAGLIADAAGDLFGTTIGDGTDNGGTVFEIIKTNGTYASTPTTLVSFSGANEPVPDSLLIADAAGDLFSTTTLQGGANADGTVFEIIKTNGTYASTPTTLVSFNNGFTDVDLQIADAAGDLFGTTPQGGASGDGTVFEIIKSNGTYATTPTTLLSFSGTDGTFPGDLIADAVGDLFGTTSGGGANGDGTVFEIIKSNGTYATTPTTLLSFNGTVGGGNLIADAAGDLFGETSSTETGSGPFVGTVFELTGSGFQVASSGVISTLNVPQQLELIYIAYFNRAADGAGFTFWEGQISTAENAGQSPAVALTNVANSFAPQPETEALYPSLDPYIGTQNPPPLNTPAGQSALITFITGVYGNLFNHAPDPGGQTYWVGQLTNGLVGLGAAALAIANGATGPDATTVLNKIAAAIAITPGASATATGSVDTNVITVTGSDQLIDPGTGSHSIQFLTGASADTLVLHAGGVDQLSGFDLATDVLGLRSMLSEANVDLNGNLAALGNYVTITDQGGAALVNFDQGGHAGGSTVAVLQGLGGVVTNLNTLLTQNAIRVA